MFDRSRVGKSKVGRLKVDLSKPAKSKFDKPGVEEPVARFPEIRASNTDTSCGFALIGPETTISNLGVIVGKGIVRVAWKKAWVSCAKVEKSDEKSRLRFAFLWYNHKMLVQIPG